MPKFSEQRKSLLSSQARIQVPWIKVTFGNKNTGYTFGVFTQETINKGKNDVGFYKAYNIQYPNYIQSLDITKINGQVNQYSLVLAYPVRLEDDPNFFEKILSSISKTRKIIFSYGDATQPSYVYKDEEAVITDVQQSFSFGGNGSVSAVITYNIKAVSGAALGTSACMTFPGKRAKPSDEIKKLFMNKSTGLQNVFTGMRPADLSKFIDGGDQEVELDTKINISALDYIIYLTGCMIPIGQSIGSTSKDIYILTIHDDTTYDRLYNNYDERPTIGPYFRVTRVSQNIERGDAYEIDIGYNTNTIVSNFQIQNNENYALYYDYQGKLNATEYIKRINRDGSWEEVYAPAVSSENEKHKTRAQDQIWWTKITKYPISASITIQGLLRPATLMTYIRLNVLFPGGKKHISSGLYIVTSQTDQISGSGYKTTLQLTKING